MLHVEGVFLPPGKAVFSEFLDFRGSTKFVDALSIMTNFLYVRKKASVLHVERRISYSIRVPCGLLDSSKYVSVR